ncbi:MAG: HEAT repeat domain-containing protein [Acidobacteria bacterium]|nr:HEAT repeat domain-containing protein [Acidobacteriota bacterium]
MTDELKALSVEELFARAVAGDEEDEGAWEAVSALRNRGGAEVFEAARVRCGSSVAKERSRALDVLGQLGAGQKNKGPHLQDRVRLAIRGLADGDETVVHAAAWALNHLGTVAGVAALLGVRRHPVQGVRRAVAASIAVAQCPEGIEAMIELTEDVDDEVRDWATFALGQFTDEASEGVLGALRRRLGDPYEDARLEAIRGLVRRRDEEGVRLLRDRFASRDWFQGDEDMALEIWGEGWRAEVGLDSEADG